MNHHDVKKFRDACRLVVAECPDGYAKAYAREGLDCSEDFIPDQKIYVLCNLSHWRGESARAVKQALRSLPS